ncbi:MAG: Nif3-like dinuclear metal center hexameric protein [Rhodothermales bacterium]|nr:Nif3-like dinuclear metal center hexameric protein [Rhodothermales bacterium]MBO6780181.1 Nif3-like dinuclear metal center hexameric protein [Rhodothermales bacterium]
MTIAELTALLEEWAPAASAESWDNSGLQIGRPETTVTGVVVALDLTPAVIQEARRLGANLVITHHPMFFSPIKQITPATLVGSMALQLAESGLAHYAIHTNLDAAREGVSFALARKLGLNHLEFLQERADDSETGLGTVGEYDEPIPIEAFLARIADALAVNGVRHVSSPGMRVRRVAVCGGSGSSFLALALASAADAYVTADVKYHQFFDALNPDGTPALAYVDVGHYESEAMTEELLVAFLDRVTDGIPVHRTAETTSPIQTWIRRV